MRIPSELPGQLVYEPLRPDDPMSEVPGRTVATPFDTGPQLGRVTEPHPAEPRVLRFMNQRGGHCFGPCVRVDHAFQIQVTGPCRGLEGAARGRLAGQENAFHVAEDLGVTYGRMDQHAVESGLQLRERYSTLFSVQRKEERHRKRRGCSRLG